MPQNAPISRRRFLQFEAAISANHLTAFRLESKFLLRSRNKLFAGKLQQKLLLLTPVTDVPDMALDSYLGPTQHPGSMVIRINYMLWPDPGTPLVYLRMEERRI